MKSEQLLRAHPSGCADRQFIGYTTGNDIVIKRNDSSSSINLDNVPFEKGKYYYFNDILNSFDIPPMESGN